ncbi:outer membrane beta-barrel protein [Mucilaginibacter sp.]|uniref:outer membrane beta-barrel protein n=1 Tax=Mucilaginibacter sp. TaxID=1882438 RepID=UPI0035BC3292
MKKFLLAVAVFATFILNASAQSENFRAFKVDISLGYASPANSTNSSSGGVSFSLHPHYRLTDQFAVGIRAEAALLAYQNGDEFDNFSSIASLNSYSLTAEYYLMDGGFRPFIGAGGGIFTQSAIQVVDANGDTNVSGTLLESKFGAFPEVGFEVGHFRVSGDYNFLPNKAGYLGVKMGFFFGGGRKDSGSSRGGNRKGRGGKYLNWEG